MCVVCVVCVYVVCGVWYQCCGVAIAHVVAETSTFESHVCCAISCWRIKKDTTN